MRLAAYQERLHLIAGLDLNAWRLSHVTDEVKPKDMDSNDVLIFLGLSKGAWTTWLGFGGGQIRVYDRQAPDEADPHRFLSRTSVFGGSFDIYRAEYGKIDMSLTWRHVQPGKDWRSRYALTMIDALQIEFGFKLLGW